MDPVALVKEPLVFGPLLILTALQAIKWFAPIVAEKKWPIPLLAVAIAFVFGPLMLRGLPWQDVALECLLAALGAMGLWSGVKTMLKPLGGGSKGIPDPLKRYLLFVCAVIPFFFISTGCASTDANRVKFGNAHVEIDRVIPQPRQVARGDDGNALLDEDGNALTEDKDVVTWRFRKNARDDDPIDHWSERMLEATATAFASIASYISDPWVGPALLLANNMTFPAMLDTGISDYAVGSDVEIRMHGSNLKAVVGKAAKHDVNSSDNEEQSGKVSTNLGDGPYFFGAFFGELTEADRALIKDLFEMDLESEDPEQPGDTEIGNGEIPDN